MSAVLIYAAHNATNHYRHHPDQRPRRVFGALRQWAQETALNSSQTTSVLRRRRNTEPAQRTRTAFHAAAPSMNCRSTIAPLAFSRSIPPSSVASLNKGPATSIGNLAGVLCAARPQVDHPVVTCTQTRCSFHGQDQCCRFQLLFIPGLRRRSATPTPRPTYSPTPCRH